MAMDWKVNADLSEEQAMLDKLEQNVTATGVEKVAGKVSDELLKAGHEAFQAKADPIHGTTWAPPSDETTRRKASGSRPGFTGLLQGLGELEGDLVSGYGITPAGATAFLNLDSKPQSYGNVNLFGLGLIHLYGVQAKARRTYMRSTKRGFRKESRRRLRPTQTLPARGFVGIPPEKLAELTTYAEQVMTP